MDNHHETSDTNRKFQRLISQIGEIEKKHVETLKKNYYLETSLRRLETENDALKSHIVTLTNRLKDKHFKWVVFSVILITIATSVAIVLFDAQNIRGTAACTQRPLSKTLLKGQTKFLDI